MIDLDFFKEINDTYGHQAGDTTITKVAEMIKASLTPSDIIGRYGGEEFLIFLKDIDKDLSIKIAERLREKIEKLVIIKNAKTISCTCSIGMFISNKDGRNQVISILDL